MSEPAVRKRIHSLIADDLADLALSEASSPELRGTYQRMALNKAVAGDRADLLGKLKAAGVDLHQLSRNGLSFVVEALHVGSLGAARYLVRQGVDVYAYSDAHGNALMAARPNPVALQMLHEEGVDLGFRHEHGDTVAHWVASSADPATWAVLLQIGVALEQPNDESLTAVDIALLQHPLNGMTRAWLAARQAREALIEIGQSPCGGSPGVGFAP